MRIKGIEIEDFVNYKEPSMFIAVGNCDWKCCVEGGFDIEVCHNSPLARAEEYEVSSKSIYDNYITNPITKAVVIGGLEPMTRFEDIIDLLEYFRFSGCHDPFIIYTGYYPNEIFKEIEYLKHYDNIILKFGRYKQNSPSKFDKILGVELSSDNQYGEIISPALDNWE